ncbi:MAG: helix-turn-helix domain-containing protein [Candidatus Marinimicrobia bacterium]|nr:helix-turn-helix domain-containing protein [Candidatus Neomarinimicrobiota bacterium]
MAEHNKIQYCEHCGSPLEKLYSIESAAKLFDCSEQFFRNLIRDRKIGFYKIGRLIRIPDSELSKITEFIPSIQDDIQLLKN